VPGAGGVHVDGTVRVQNVHEAPSPRLTALLREFEKFTGVPAVLNTSFNDREPIVETPAHPLAIVQDSVGDGGHDGTSAEVGEGRSTPTLTSFLPAGSTRGRRRQP
jgi:hypothetical protein